MNFNCVTAFIAPFEFKLLKPPVASLFSTCAAPVKSNTDKCSFSFQNSWKRINGKPAAPCLRAAPSRFHLVVSSGDGCLPSTEGRLSCAPQRGKTPAVWKKRLTAGTHHLAEIALRFIMARLRRAPELRSDAGVGAAGRLVEAVPLIVGLPTVVLCRRCSLHDNRRSSVNRLKLLW